jgi:DNA-binding transcriptional LysR family regulator
MELRHLRCFSVVAEELHFGRAAERLYLTQPALTRQIQALEQTLQVQLFDRNRRRVELTPAGQAFLQTVHQLLGDLEQGIQQSRYIARKEAKQLRIGVTVPALYQVIPDIMKRYKQKYPNIEITIIGQGTEAQVMDLQNNRLDVGVLHLPISDVALSIEPLCQASLLLALPATHRLAKQKKIALRSLHQEPLIFHPRAIGAALYAQFEQRCEQAGFMPNIVQEVERVDARLGLVRSGVGIALVLSGFEALKLQGIVYRELKEHFSALQLALAWRTRNNSPHLQAFIEIAKQLVSFDTMSSKFALD